MIATLTLTLTACLVARVAAQIAFRRFARKQPSSVQAEFARAEPTDS